MIAANLSTKDYCHEPKTNGTKIWPYNEYYIGENDELKQRKGYGENHWSGAKSLETYSGSFLHDTMHGLGEYRWRFHDVEGSFTTYEGRFYSNRMHGYGVMSYDDGRVFKGLYYEDVRWGPGVESHACLRADVGLWRGKQLMRLTWMPNVPVIPDLNSNPESRKYIKQYRLVLTTATKLIGEVNSALDLLKREGYDPATAPQKWMELYAKTCTDPHSVLCHREAFDKAYFGDTVQYLSVADKDELNMSRLKSEDSSDVSDNNLYFYGWNNNSLTIHMMCHSYRHEQFRFSDLNLTNVLSGPRTAFKPAGHHELDCRTFLMACYIGNIHIVTNFMVDGTIYVNLSDLQGNSALMYATAGKQTDLIHFLVEAGADVNWHNDGCVTPLGVALLNYLAVQCEVPEALIVDAVIPPADTEKIPKHQIFDWYISRERSPTSLIPPQILTQTMSLRKMRSSSIRRVRSIPNKSFMSIGSAAVDPNARDHTAYNDMLIEYSSKLAEIFNRDMKFALKMPYLFEVANVTRDIKSLYDDQKPTKEENVGRKSQIDFARKKSAIKLKTSKIALSRSSHQQFKYEENSVSIKKTSLNQIMETIKQLLDDGADPRLVCSPEPALVIAIAAESPELAELLIDHGAKVNVVYEQFLDNTPLDLVLARPLSDETMDLMKTLLENGAKANNRSPSDVPPDPGPTLLHVLLGKPYLNEMQEIIRRQMMTMLINYGCDPTAFYMGRSAIDVAVTRRLDLMNVFINNPKTNLNAIVNDSNQTILTKIFNLSFFKTLDATQRKDILMNLLLHGADPLLECPHGDTTYPNLFVYIIENLEKISPKVEKKSDTDNTKAGGKKEGGSQKTLAPQKTLPSPKTTSQKQLPKVAKMENPLEYTLAMSQVADCVRMLHVRWIQGKLMKELLEVVIKFKHRTWHLIMKEFHNRKNARLWLNTERCLQIWDILKKSKSRFCTDNHVLRHLLSIIYYFNIRHHLSVKLTFPEKEKIDSDVALMMRDHRLTSADYQDIQQDYVKPELFPRNEKKFNVCFDCYLPLGENPVLCKSCKLVSFCNFDCMKENCLKVQDHPCTKFLVDKYFPDFEST